MPALRVHMSNVMNTPAEVIEAEYPLHIVYQRLRSGSGGAGVHRGGEGQHRAYRVTGDAVSLTTMFERAVVPPYGLEGGEPGKLFVVEVIPVNSPPYKLSGKTNVTLKRGDIVVVKSCGGGGYGKS
jgi:N-methylhydantoinase B